MAWNRPGKIDPGGAGKHSHATQGALEAMRHVQHHQREDGWTFGLIQQCVCTRIYIKKKNYLLFESPKSGVCVSL